MAWALATVNYHDKNLLAALARAVERRVRELNAQGFANTAWPLATVIETNAILSTALARAVERRVSEIN